MQLFLACVLVFVAAVIPPGEAVTCYKCVYPTTDACEKPSGSNVPTCNGTSCSKAVLKKDGEAAIIRGCLPTHEKTECASTEVWGVKAKGCTCSTDLCNGASLPSVATVSVLALVVFAAVVASWF
ncbi:hypothetical protein LSAT2_015057 [Lamellibrachia satsuma]|nr:hypothetical protein LSAT2_015057 [Lamellibrachia satsuma]